MLAALIALSCLPFWILSYLPTQDGPAHLNAAAILSWYNSVPDFRTYFEIRWTGAGNLLCEALCAALLRLTAPETADRLIVTSYLILLPLAVRFALKPLSNHPSLFALASLPLANNFFLYMGFWEFCYGVVLFFFGLGVYLRLRNRRTAVSFLWLASLSFLTYLAHVVAFAALTIATLVFAAVEVVCQSPSSDKSLWRRLKPLWFAGAAAIPASLVFLPWLFAPREHVAAWSPSFLLRLRSLFGMTFVAGYGDREAAFLLLLAAVFGLLVVIGIRNRIPAFQFKYSDGFGIAALLFGLLAFVLPDVIGDGTLVLIRIDFFVWLCLLCWLAVQPLTARIAAIFCAVMVLLTCVQLSLRYPAYVLWSHRALEYQSIGSNIPKGAIYASIDLERQTYRILPTRHMADLFGAKPAVNLTLYEASSTHFPIQYRRPPDLRLAEYLVVEAPLNQPWDWTEIQNQLRDRLQGYTITTASETGRLRLYRRAASSAAR